MANRSEQRLKDFWLLRRQLEHMTSDQLRERLKNKQFNQGATVAREILRERGEPES